MRHPRETGLGEERGAMGFQVHFPSHSKLLVIKLCILETRVMNLKDFSNFPCDTDQNTEEKDLCLSYTKACGLKPPSFNYRAENFSLGNLVWD